MPRLLLALIVAELGFGQVSFEVASIKLAQNPPFSGVGPLSGGRLAGNATVSALIANAYGVSPSQVVGGPSWSRSERYEIDARAEGNPPKAQMWLMVQTLLRERFQLALRRESRELPVYRLEISKGGVRRQNNAATCVPADPNATPLPPGPDQPSRCGSIVVSISGGEARLRSSAASAMDLAGVLSNVLGRPVLNKTGSNSALDFDLQFLRDDTLVGIPDGPLVNDANLPSIFSAMREQLGLELKSAREPVEVLVIESVERPSPN